MLSTRLTFAVRRLRLLRADVGAYRRADATAAGECIRPITAFLAPARPTRPR
jgi:hypothetical protein